MGLADYICFLGTGVYGPPLEIQTTFDIYGHLMPGTGAEAAALMDAFLDRDQ